MRHQPLRVLSAAAAKKRQGVTASLSQIGQVTRQLLGNLGATAPEIRETLLSVYSNWIDATPPSYAVLLTTFNYGKRQIHRAGGRWWFTILIGRDRYVCNFPREPTNRNRVT
jgi:hypothetical protein